MKTLDKMKTGERGRIGNIQSGAGFATRLAEMGILPGTEILVVTGGGPVIIEVRRHRVIIGRGMAHQMTITPLNACAKSDSPHPAAS